MLEKLPDAVGQALSGVRAGLAQTVYQALDLRQGLAALTVTSVAFTDHAPLPDRYTADGPGLSPPLHWQGVPAAASEVLLVVEDGDSPTPLPLVHAIAHGLPAGAEGSLAEGALSHGRSEPLSEPLSDPLSDAHSDAHSGALTDVGEARPRVAMGRNSLLQARWLPPDPPPGHGVHRYAFQVFALGPGQPLPEQPGREAVREALRERALASGCLIGTYERPSGSIPEPLGPGPLAPA